MNTVKEALSNELITLKNARDILQYSYDKCSLIGVKTGLTYEEMESYEALTSRFARLSDIIIQKIFRFFDILNLEATGTVRDRINRAEKMGVIESADKFVEIRILRNDIAHEYKSETIYEIFEQVLEFTPILLKSVEGILTYSERYVGEGERV
jgi:uncharacterized protein with HEPN domain